MNIKQLNIWISYCGILLAVAGCNSGKNIDENSLNTSQSQKPAVGDSDNLIPIVDLMSLDYNLNDGFNASPPPQCSSDNQVCAGVDNIPSASYALNSYGENSWTIPNANVVLTVTFNAAIPPDFHITEMYNDLESNGLVGHLGQVDSSNCDQLDKQARTSCKINLAYIGDAFNGRENIIHVIFNWGQGQHSLDYNFAVKNKVPTMQNVPIINYAYSEDPLLIYLPPIDTGNGINFNYNASNQVQLKNVGTDKLHGYSSEADPDHPTIKVALGSQFSAGISSLHYTNKYFTECRNNDLDIGSSCMFQFYYLPESGLNIVNPMGRLVYTYLSSYDDEYLPPLRGNTYTFAQRFILSIGNFQPVNEYATTYQGSINLQKLNQSNQYIAYSPILSDFKLSAKIEPQFDIPYTMDEKRAYFGIGDWCSSDGKTCYTAQQLLNNLHLEYDQNCFNSGFNPSADNKLVAKTCSVKYSFSGLVWLDKPLKLNIYASYATPTDNSNVTQLVGILDITPSTKLCNVKHKDSQSFTIPAGSVMAANDCYLVESSAPGTLGYKLIQQSRGELAIFQCSEYDADCSNSKIWSSGVQLSPSISGAYSQFLTDGNLETFAPGYGYFDKPSTMVNVANWVSNTYPQSGSEFRFNTDGSLEIIKNNNLIWSTKNSHGMMRCSQDGAWHPAEQCPQYHGGL